MILDPTVDITITTVLFFFSTLFFSQLLYELKRLQKKVDELQQGYYQVNELLREVKDLNRKLEEIEQKYIELDYKLKLIMKHNKIENQNENST